MAKERLFEDILADEVFGRYIQDARTKAEDGLNITIFKACYANVAHQHDIFHGNEPDRYNLFFRLVRTRVSAKLKRVKARPVKEKAQPPRRSSVPTQLPLFGPPEWFKRWAENFKAAHYAE